MNVFRNNQRQVYGYGDFGSFANKSPARFE